MQLKQVVKRKGVSIHYSNYHINTHALSNNINPNIIFQHIYTETLAAQLHYVWGCSILLSFIKCPLQNHVDFDHFQVEYPLKQSSSTSQQSWSGVFPSKKVNVWWTDKDLELQSGTLVINHVFRLNTPDPHYPFNFYTEPEHKKKKAKM